MFDKLAFQRQVFTLQEDCDPVILPQVSYHLNDLKIIYFLSAEYEDHASFLLMVE